MVNELLNVILFPDFESVAGIVAGRVKDRYYKPSIVLTDSGNGELKGSGRSISEYNMFEKLMECKELLGRFGGHPMAAGMSLDKEDLEEEYIECKGTSTNSLNIKDIEDAEEYINSVRKDIFVKPNNLKNNSNKEEDIEINFDEFDIIH